MSQSLTAVILAAGHGTRMRSRTPKVLHAVCGRPMLDWVIDAVRDAGADKIKVVINPHHAEVAAHLAEKKLEATYQRDPRGTAQGEENAARLHLARIGVIGGEPLADLGPADLTAARGLEDLEEGQTHLHK